MENFKKVWVYEDSSFNCLGVHYSPQEEDLVIEMSEGELEELEKLNIEALNEYIQNKVARFIINH